MAANVAVTLSLLIGILAVMCLTGCISRHVSATSSLASQHQHLEQFLQQPPQLQRQQQQQHQQESTSLTSTPSSRQQDGKRRKNRRKQQNQSTPETITVSKQPLPPQLTTTTTTPVPPSSLSTKRQPQQHQQQEQEERKTSLPTISSSFNAYEINEQYFTASQDNDTQQLPQQQPSQSPQQQQDDDNDSSTVSLELSQEKEILLKMVENEFSEDNKAALMLIREVFGAFESLKEIAENARKMASHLIDWPTYTQQTLVVREDRTKLAQQLEEDCVPLLIQQRVDQSNFFNRSWDEFKVGFNASNGNYWLGNELLHQLTKDGKYKLRVDLQSRSNVYNWFWAEYAEFIVHSESQHYMLQIGDFSGNVYYDHLGLLNGSRFSTYDKPYSSRSLQYFHNYRPHGFWQITHDDYDDDHGYRRYCWNSYGHLNAFEPLKFQWCRLTQFYLANQGDPCALQTSRMWLVCQ